MRIRDLKIAIFQGPAQSGTIEEQLTTMRTQAKTAAEQNVNLLIFPEKYLTGYNIGAENVARLAQPVNGPAAQTAAEIASQNGIALLYGYAERDGDKVYNAALLIDAQGNTITNYRKSHLWGEVDKASYDKPNEPFQVVELNGVRIGILICYDVEFPETVRSLALAGAEFIAVPTALMCGFETVARMVVPIRAYENQVFMAYANRCDVESELDYVGESCVVGPDGIDLGRAENGEEMIIADLELKQIETVRKELPYHEDRRPELYGSIVD